MDLENKIAVVTGVSKGIGKACVQLLLDEKTIVYGLGRNKPIIENPNFYFIECDVRNYNSVRNAFSEITKHNSIHVLINNAGLGYFAYFEDATIEQWDEMMQTNVNGVFYCCKETIPSMKKNGIGHIINISSTAGLEGYPQVGAYNATKFAVRGLSDALYKELRDFKIKVTCVYPGSVKTDFFRNAENIEPHDYMLMPEDVASMILWAIKSPDNFHQVNLEVRPLQPKGPKN